MSEAPIFIIAIHPPSADICQFWVFLDFDAPSLVVAQMPMKRIDFVKTQVIDVSLDFGGIEKMSTHIQMHSAVREFWIVFDLHR